MLEGMHFAVFVEENTNPTEYNYCRLRLKEAGARVTVIGLTRLEYRLEDHSPGYADVMIDELPQTSFDGVVIPGGLGPESDCHRPAMPPGGEACVLRSVMASRCSSRPVYCAASKQRQLGA